MPPNGKFASGLKGFPTPNDVPPDGGYVVFRIPKDNEWAGLILGAAQALAQSYNWYQWGDMSPDEASEAFRLIVTQAPYESCGCNQPGGGRVLRVGNDGHIQQLTDGEWTAPTDDYEIPPVPPRSELTCDERRCAAAANAANVLQQLYEEVADAVAEGADEAEALAALVGAAIIIIGGWLGLALAALVGLIEALFFSFLEIAEFMTADLWTSDFTEKLKCFLYECSSCDGDVVTFDFQCVRQKMAEYTDILDPNVITNIRLFGQVDFILNVIGVDGLNAAGATTAITVFDCSECASEWCYTKDLTTGDGGFVPTFGSYAGADGWEATNNFVGGYDRTLLAVRRTMDTPVHITRVSWEFDWYHGTVITGIVGSGFFTDNFATEQISTGMEALPDADNQTQGGDVDLTPDSLDFLLQCSINGYGGSANLLRVSIQGDGEKPTYLEADGWIECTPDP